jgi:formylglycine-generating enzyme required for sulfatase activity
MRLATAILVTAILVGVAAVARAPTAQPAGGTSKINPKDGLTYVWISPATFRMGCLGPVSEGLEQCLGNELPRHSVKLTKGFWLGQTLVTQVVYRQVMGLQRSAFRGDQMPVDAVSWDAAKAFCERVGMRLPTEAQ